MPMSSIIAMVVAMDEKQTWRAFIGFSVENAILTVSALNVSLVRNVPFIVMIYIQRLHMMFS